MKQFPKDADSLMDLVTRSGVRRDSTRHAGRGRPGDGLYVVGGLCPLVCVLADGISTIGG